MRLVHSIIAFFVLTFSVIPCFSQTLEQPYTDRQDVIVTVPDLGQGYTVRLQAFSNCAAGATELGPPYSHELKAGTSVSLSLYSKLKKSDKVCVTAIYTPVPASAPAPEKSPTTSELKTTVDLYSVSDLCARKFNDCNWGYIVAGGVEQAGTSALASQTEPFIDFFARGPRDGGGWGSIWTEVRLLGTPTNSNTGGVVAAATDPSGTLTSSTLASVGSAVDYVIGYEYSLRKTDLPHSFGLIFASGATTPFSSQSATVAYAVPSYGTMACASLLDRFTGNTGYAPGLPGSGTITTTTTVTTGSTSSTSTSTSPTYCSVNPVPSSTTASLAGTTVVTQTSGTQITNVAFSPVDRSSFLLKYLAGVRYVYRMRPKGTDICRGANADSPTDNCSRLVADFTLGQDEAITGGALRHLVLKSTMRFEIPGTGIFLFGSAAIRMQKNRNLDPLVLAQTPIYTGSGSAPTGSLTIPSASVFVLPLRQSDRDFYRIGIALDLAKLLPKLFVSSKT